MSAKRKTRDVRAAIDAHNHDFVDAFRRRDAAAIARLHTSDGQLFPPEREIISGTPAIQEYWHEAMKSGVRQLITTELDIKGEAAHEVGLYRIVRPDGSHIEAGHYIVVWKAEGDCWKMHRDMWTKGRV